MCVLTGDDTDKQSALPFYMNTRYFVLASLLFMSVPYRKYMYSQTRKISWRVTKHFSRNEPSTWTAGPIKSLKFSTDASLAAALKEQQRPITTLRSTIPMANNNVEEPNPNLTYEVDLRAEGSPAATTVLQDTGVKVECSKAIPSTLPSPVVQPCQKLAVTVPPTFGPGMTLTIMAPDGGQLQVQIPAGVTPGQTFHAEWVSACPVQTPRMWIAEACATHAEYVGVTDSASSNREGPTRCSHGHLWLERQSWQIPRQGGVALA